MKNIHLKIPVVFLHGRSFNLVNFGIFAAIGSMLGYSISFYYLYSRGIQINNFCWEIVLTFNLLNILFSKLYGMFLEGPSNYFRNFLHYFNETSFYNQGGVISFFFGTILLSVLLEIPLAILGDAVCLGGIVTMAIGRIGCHYYGCCTGKPSDSRFSITYSDPNAKICRDDIRFLNTPLFPVQLISSAINFLIFAIFIIVSIQFPFSGLIMITFIVGFNLKRFIIQNYRLKPTANKIPYRMIALVFIVSFVLIILFFNYMGDLFFEETPAIMPFTAYNFLRFLVSDFNILGSLILVAIINFIAYGIHGRKIGTHLNLSK